MATELAFALINPYTIAKSRTGGVVGRFMSRTGLDLVAARMFCPSRELVERSTELILTSDPTDSESCALLADYMRRAYMPFSDSNRPRRTMMLLFEGEDAIRRIAEVTGHVRLQSASGESIRDTYGDYITDIQNNVTYFEPAVIVGRTKEAVAGILRVWAECSENDGGLVDRAIDVSGGQGVERTLVLIKPDNFRFPSARPGNIIDLLSRAGMRIIGAKVVRMSVAQAEEFYRPVRMVLRDKFKGFVAERVSDMFMREFGVSLPEDVKTVIGNGAGPMFGDHQFSQIVQFMTGSRPTECTEEEKRDAGKEKCLALVYKGSEAVRKIRSLLGTTDPSKAEPGSIRREFGRDVMVNAAHASDSAENAEREIKILDIAEDTIKPWVAQYYGT